MRQTCITIQDFLHALSLSLLLCLGTIHIHAEELVMEKPEKDQVQWYQEARQLYFGVPVQLRFSAPLADQEKSQALAARVWAYLESIDDHFNDYKEGTEVSRINASGKGIYAVSPMMADALRLSFEAYRLSEGAFDISVGPLRRLWKEAAKSGVYPDDRTIREAQAQLGMHQLYVDDDELYVLREGINLDFGGIIKGIAVDHAMSMLIDAGIKNALVQVGGETAAIGLSPRNKPHVLAIPDPKNNQEFIALVQDPGTGYSGCTSGNYRLPIIINDKPYYHIFDPRSGEPCDVHILSVSVVFPQLGRNGLADALSTSGVVLGPEKLIALVDSLGGACMVISEETDGSMKFHQSAHWDKFLKK